MYNIIYKIRGYKGEFSAGPYSLDDVKYHKIDIETFAGIYDVHVMPVISL